MKELLAIIERHSSAIEPIPTGMAPRLRTLPGIRAVIFDIYGTLFISGSGDISLAEKQDREGAMRDVLREEGIKVPANAALNAGFHDLIKASHEKSRAGGIDFPEVEIRQVWRNLLSGLGCQCEDALIERIAVRFEIRVNPVWPMPGLGSLIHELGKRAGTVLGIVSNAQFYTPLLFEHFLGGGAVSLGFQDSLCIWSYREGIAKPSCVLFEKLAAALKTRGIDPGESLYVGNDMRNDILAAASVGMRTALFAGDERSLRLRDHSLANLPCDLVLTELRHLQACLA